MKNRFLSSFAVLFVAFGLNSCGTLDVRNFGIEENEKGSKYQAGTVDIATFKPIVWSTISDDLKPNFGIKNAKELLAEVAPVVGGDDYRASQRLAIELASTLGGPVLDKTVTSNATSDIDALGAETETGSTAINSTVTQSTPDAITISPATLASLITAPSALDEANSGYSFDPHQKYKGALALFQKIILLDRYLDEPLDEDDKTAHLIRAQITVSPFARQQPYDVYTTLSFDLTDLTERSENSDKVKYRIFPLIVADNLERTNTRRIAESLQSIQSSLGARQGLFAAGGGVNNALDKLRSLVGSDLSSLVTYTQPHDNSLAIRFAAPFDAKSGYSMRARTYDVTFVVVTETAGDNNLYDNIGTPIKMSVFAENVLRHVRTGEAIPDINEKDIETLEKRVATLMKTLSFTPVVLTNGSTISGSQGLVHEVIYQNNDAVAAEVISLFRTSLRDSQLHADLQRARDTRLNKFSDIELKQLDFALPNSQTPTLLDDGKTTTVQLVGRSRPSLRKMVAELSFTPTNPSTTSSTANQNEYGPFRHIAMSHTDSIYQIKFPSLSSLGIDLAKGKLVLELDYNKGAKSEVYIPRALKASKTPVREASFKVTQFSTGFTEGSGTNGAHARIVVDAKSKSGAANDIKSYRLTILGAPLAQLNQLNSDGTIKTDSGIVMDSSKNAAVFTSLGAAYDIILKGIKVPANTEINCKIEGLDSAAKVITQELVSIKYAAKPATAVPAGK